MNDTTNINDWIVEIDWVNTIFVCIADDNSVNDNGDDDMNIDTIRPLYDRIQ